VLVEGPLNNLKPSMMQLGKPKKVGEDDNEREVWVSPAL
jgi:hypothetical protein